MIEENSGDVKTLTWLGDLNWLLGVNHNITYQGRKVLRAYKSKYPKGHFHLKVRGNIIGSDLTYFLTPDQFRSWLSEVEIWGYKFIIC